MIFGWTIAIGCGGNPDDSPRSESPPWSSIEGTLEYDVVVAGVTLCDATIAFTGVPYAGFCPDCAFAFDVEPTVTRDEGTIACPYSPVLSLYANSAILAAPTVVALAPTYEYVENGVTDLVLVGFTQVNEDGDVEGPYAAYALFYDGSYYGGHASLTGETLTWGLAMGAGTDHYVDLIGWRYDYYPSYCSFDYLSTAVAPYDSGHTLYGSLPCARDAIDTFTFEGVAGGTIDITLDVTGGNPSLNPMMWVHGPDSCVERVGDDNFACTGGDNLCPALSVSTDPGEYVLVVESSFDCPDDPGTASEYRLDLASSWDPALTPVLDDESNVGPATIRVEATATLVEY